MARFQSLSRDSARSGLLPVHDPGHEREVSIPLSGFRSVWHGSCISQASLPRCFNPSLGIPLGLATHAPRPSSKLCTRFQSLSRDSARSGTASSIAGVASFRQFQSLSRDSARSGDISRVPAGALARVSIPLSGFRSVWLLQHAPWPGALGIGFNPSLGIPLGLARARPAAAASAAGFNPSLGIPLGLAGRSRSG